MFEETKGRPGSDEWGFPQPHNCVERFSSKKLLNYVIKFNLNLIFTAFFLSSLVISNYLIACCQHKTAKWGNFSPPLLHLTHTRKLAWWKADMIRDHHVACECFFVVGIIKKICKAWKNKNVKWVKRGRIIFMRVVTNN